MNTRTYLVLAVLLASIGSQQAHAGMSGMSNRIQEHSTREAQGSLPPAPTAQPVVQAPQRQQARPQPARPQGGQFDGVWAVSASPGCGLAESSAVEVVRGRIVAPGVSGSVDAAGNVRTVGHGGGLSVISTGRTGPTAGSGTYTVSNGCTGTWTSRKA
jgi:hypothetical protein